MVAQVGYSMAGDREVGWRCVRSASCAWRRGVRVSLLSLKTKVNGLASKPLGRFFQFGLKTGGNDFL
jgi:hypothetical protein